MCQHNRQWPVKPGGLVRGWPGCPPVISRFALPVCPLLSGTEISVTSAPDHPLQFKPGKASTGRVYNAYTGGKDNFEADRALAGQVVEIAPDAAGRAADLAGFSLAAAAVIAADVRQLVDIGAGTPGRYSGRRRRSAGR